MGEICENTLVILHAQGDSSGGTEPMYYTKVLYRLTFGTSTLRSTGLIVRVVAYTIKALRRRRFAKGFSGCNGVFNPSTTETFYFHYGFPRSQGKNFDSARYSYVDVCVY